MLGPMVSLQTRLVPNPCIGVNELMKPLAAFQKLKGADTDIAKVIVPKMGKITWKTAPNVAWLVSLKPLLRSYLEIATNAVLPSKKHKTAITNLCKEKRAEDDQETSFNKTKHSNDDFSDLIDMYIRIACAQLRALKSDEIIAARTWQKTSESESNALQELLGLIDPEVKVANPAATSKAAPPIPSSWQIVVAEHPADAICAGTNSSSSVLVPEPSEVFQRILAKRVSDSLSPTRYAADVSDVSKPISHQKSFLEVALGAEEEAQLLLAARQQEPLAKGGKSLLSRIRANNKKSKKSAHEKKKADGNLKSKATAMKKDQKKKATKTATSSSASPPTSSKKLSKAATSSSASPPTSSNQHLKAATSSSSSPTTLSKQPLKRLKAKTPCPQEETSEQPVDQITLRRRALSKAYHKARVLALKEAYDANCVMTEEMKKEAEAAAKIKAQEAYKAAAIAFDK